MSPRQTRPTGKKPVNPEGFLATQDLKDRGWTPPLIRRFLGEHDTTRENGLRMGRRRLPPVKLYAEARVLEVERDDTFLAAQARAADARARAEQAREVREMRRAALLEAAAESYIPVVHPEPLRKGAVRKAREPYLPEMGRIQVRLEQEIGRVSARESAVLATLLRKRLDEALAAAYPWYPGSGAQPTPSRQPEARPSDWREWDWD
ncbi:hypothetical protein DEDE109153_02570 [Deinococcus deserti]|uniref:Uncharacterized protein n=1 Tax=Deinococcus deserti (strain DSM 17065 / CIP 109153 / LMG 22923 / VCD115) TaxID=546414 RepID=C1CUU6_DEIDV|nr:hypothetical protein [Deinococcus deserti]ACO45963.1 hypothetical protein Deide_10710 [Deinococcus deserti VCD115]